MTPPPPPSPTCGYIENGLGNGSEMPLVSKNVNFIRQKIWLANNQGKKGICPISAIDVFTVG